MAKPTTRGAAVSRLDKRILLQMRSVLEAEDRDGRIHRRGAKWILPVIGDGAGVPVRSRRECGFTVTTRGNCPGVHGHAPSWLEVLTKGAAI